MKCGSILYNITPGTGRGGTPAIYLWHETDRHETECLASKCIAAVPVSYDDRLLLVLKSLISPHWSRLHTSVDVCITWAYFLIVCLVKENAEVAVRDMLKEIAAEAKVRTYTNYSALPLINLATLGTCQSVLMGRGNSFQDEYLH